jgi:pSer/pThr/pTyr-binding forkhead associated (FHA) protein
MLSREHVAIRIVNDFELQIEDLKSLNGVYVRLSENKQKSRLFKINHNDILKFGPIDF